MPNSEKCPRCGLRQGTRLQFCPACGYEFADDTSPKVGSTTARSPSTQSHPSASATLIPSQVLSNTPVDARILPPSKAFDPLKLIGWTTLIGIVVGMEPMYMAKPPLKLAQLSAKVLLGIIAFPFVFAALAVGFIIFQSWSLFLRVGPRNQESGFFSKVASQVLGFYLAGKLFRPAELVPVRDIRLREADNTEHLVRINGEFKAGNVAVGDEIEVSGFNRFGTLVFTRGINLRTRSQILLR